MRRHSFFLAAALSAAPGCEQVTLGLPDLIADAAVTQDSQPSGPGPVIDSINGGLPVPVRGGGAQFTIAGQRLLGNNGQPAVDALLNGSPANLRVLAGQLSLVTDAQALTRAELSGVAELRLRSREKPELMSQSRLFRYYIADTPVFKPGPALPALAAPLALGELDGDAQLDRVEASNFSLTFKLTGGAKVDDIATAGDTILAVALADLNGDRRLDLVAVYRSGSNHSAVVYYRREGTTPSFDMAATLQLPGGASNSAASISIGDVNDDGRSDLTISLNTPGRPNPYNVFVFTS